MALDPTPVVTALIGAVAGFAGGLFSRPAAKGKVDEEAIKQQQRRAMIDGARQMLAQARQERWNDARIANDSRCEALVAVADERTFRMTQEARKMPPLSSHFPQADSVYAQTLESEAARLERNWNLV
jgi:uncharacterized membrane protein